MSLCATEGCSSPGRAGCFEPQKTEPRCACTGPPRFTALGRRSHAQNEQLKRAHSKQQNYDCDPIIFEPMPAHCIHGRTFPLSDSPVTLALPCFRAISQESIFVSRFVVKTRPTFRGLWRKFGMVVDAPDARLHLAAMQCALVDLHRQKKPRWSDTIDPDEVITAVAKTVAELTYGQDGAIRQQLIEQLVRRLWIMTQSFAEKPELVRWALMHGTSQRQRQHQRR